ncbi:phage tail tape measure protein [Flavobacterium sp. SUN046]|uniref:phage tail tape measure protein n=1 Tax=Flavobacterium sp. SUN046 TaxID=3002440 RepID=UPI002DBDF503|nr:phage tail tape measure protein [Flavobacterium sp. SUN046]MEC4050600.1 phage tail tape measure protein [Flavobacterium sp. SUN046]
MTNQNAEATAKLAELKDKQAKAEQTLNKEIERQSIVWKEQIALENNLISTKKKNELATESTARALAAERIQLTETNKQIKQEAMERLGLVSAYTKLNNERNEAKKVLRDLILTEGENSKATKQALRDFEALDAKVKSADRAVGDFTKNVGNYPFQNLTSGLKNLVGAFGLAGGISLFAGALKGAYQTVKEFEQGIADLSAITGASGKDLDFLKNSAIELGKTTQGGAIAVVEAYKLIASAKPELLENVQALNQVTEATITLSKAAGMELPEAASALTDAMNQFGADASQAGVFVDALANGAKYGSAEIPQVTEALLKFGAVARSTNVNIKESTALVELLAENGLKGTEAGTALRNVMLKLSAPDALPREAQKAIKDLGISFDFLKDKSIPFQEKLEALKPLLKDNANIVKTFGVENATAAINIISHTDRLKELTSKMGEVGTAEEQAAIRMNTLSGKTEQLSSTYDSFILSIGKGNGIISNFFKFFIDEAKTALDLLIKINETWDEKTNKAKQKGTSEGQKIFQERFNALKDTGDEKSVAQSIRDSRNSELELRQKDLRELYQKTVRLVNKSGLKGEERVDFINKTINPQQKNELMATIAEIRAMQNAADQVINGLKPKQKISEVGLDESTASSPVDDKAKKEAEKRLREQQEAEKKRIELVISSMKLTLDNQIATYNQSEHLDNENLAHVEVISNMKIAIAKEELKKNLIGIKEKSNEEKSIKEASNQEIIKIENERQKAVNQIKFEGAKFELELYDFRNKTLLTEGATINDLLINQEKKRIDEEYRLHKEGIERQYGLDAEKIQQKNKNNEKLTEQELKFLKELDSIEKKKIESSKKADEVNLNSKLKHNAEEEKDENKKYKEKEKSAYKNSVNELKNEKKRLQEDLKLVEGNAQKEAEIKEKLAENQNKLNTLVSNSKKESLQTGLNAFIEVTGRESELGKTAAVAQSTINTYEGATKEFAKGGVLGFVTGGLVIAAGLAEVAKIEGIQMFAEGTTNAPYTGKAIVDEFGAEIHLGKNGNIKSMGSNKGARFTDIAKGDVIIPADVSAIIRQTMFASYGIKNETPAIDYDEIGAQFGKHASKIVSAIQHKKESNTIINIQKDLRLRATFQGKRV